MGSFRVVCADGQPIRRERRAPKAGAVKQFCRQYFELPPAPGRIVPMEGLRGVAALMVLLVHFHSLFFSFAGGVEPAHSVSLFLSTIGHTGVDLFFVLSGYLMYGVMLRSDFRLLPYLRRRAERLYPVFLAVFICYVLLSFVFPDKSKLPAGGRELALYLLTNLLMLPGILPIEPMITQAWSLSYEWLFYLAGPLVVMGTGLRQRRWQVRMLVLLALAAGYLTLCALRFAAHPRMIMFLAGCLLWEAARNGQLERFLSRRGEFLAVTAFLANLALIGWIVPDPLQPIPVFHVRPGSYTGLFFLASFWFVAYGLFYKGWLAQFFSLDPLRWAGNISYSYYLVHGMALHGLRRMVPLFLPEDAGSAWLYVLLFAVALVVTLIAGAVFYLLFEKPFLHISANRTAGSRVGYYRLDGVTAPPNAVKE